MKKLTPEEIEKYQKVYESFYTDPRVIRMKEIEQHRGSNTFLHACKVTKMAYKLGKISIFKIHFEDMIMGAMLHDYFLYNWRIDRSKLKGHGHKHPLIALERARQDYPINDRVANIISSHMWPINLFHVHLYREAHVVSIADKLVSLKEALTSKKYKQKHEDKLVNLFNLEAK